MSENNGKTVRKISRENAEKEMQRFFDYYELDAADLVADQQLIPFNHARNKCIKAFEKGRLYLKNAEDGTLLICQKLVRSPAYSELGDFEYGHLDGRCKLNQKNAEDGGDSYVLMGILCGQGYNTCSKLKDLDMSLLESLSLFFLLV